MVSPPGGAGTHAGPVEPLEASPDALVERLRRRISALERQLEARITEVDGHKARLAHQERAARAAEEDAAVARAAAEALRAKASEYDALMRTLTMRGLRLPRHWYGLVRGRLSGSAGR